MKTNRLFFVIAVYSFSFCVMGQMKIQNDGQISIVQILWAPLL